MDRGSSQVDQDSAEGSYHNDTNDDSLVAVVGLCDSRTGRVLETRDQGG